LILYAFLCGEDGIKINSNTKSYVKRIGKKSVFIKRDSRAVPLPYAETVYQPGVSHTAVSKMMKKENRHEKVP